MKLSTLLEDYVLPQSDAHVILILDEADRLLNALYRDDFFSMLRAWHGNRARRSIWHKLDMIMVISSEPNALIHDINRSPFNVGHTIELDDFDATQVTELNQRYHSPLAEQELEALCHLLGGHPFLTALALYTVVTEQATWPQIAQTADADKGPFADHLRRYLRILRGQPDLRQAFKDVIDHGQCSDDQLFFRLAQLGLVKGIDALSCECRCDLYTTYFKARL